MSKLIPQYSIFEAMQTAIALGMRALHEIRTLARTPGPRGADGLGFEDLSFMQTGDRSFKLRFARGDIVKEWPITFHGLMFYRGVWVARQFEHGDVVTYGGCMWVALKDTSEKPQEGIDWQLSVKKGRDGRDGELKAPRPNGPVKVG